MNNQGEVILVLDRTIIITYKEGGYKEFIDVFPSYSHELFFGRKSSKIPKEFKKLLQLNPKKRRGDWFLFRNQAIIWIWFIGTPI